MKIVIFGPKGAGKTSLGNAISRLSGLSTYDTDDIIETLYASKHGTNLSCREMVKNHGEPYFRSLEVEAAHEAAQLDWCVVTTGGGLMMHPDSRRLLRNNAILVYIYAEPDVLWVRATARGIPPWLEGEDGPGKFLEQTSMREEVLLPYADILLDTTEDSPDLLASRLLDQIGQEIAVRCRSANTYGDVIRMTGFGESHGVAIGTVLEGLKPGIDFTLEDIQHQMDRRRPGQSKVVTQRKEPDEVEILSGVFNGKTTGAPIAMIIRNQDQRSKNYDDIKDVFRPGHGDFTFYKKYKVRDYRGGGRQSGRETACRVAAGAIPMKYLLERGVRIVAHAVEIAGISAEKCDYDVIEQNVVRCADSEAAKLMEQAILQARSDRDSVGGIIQLDITGLPPGIGDPIFGKLDARLVTAIMTIGAIKGVEVGDGFAITKLRGSQANDAMKDGTFTSNHTGGILGGISTGQPVVMRVAVKPTASIAKKQQAYDIHDVNREIEVLGRHDPCIVPRAVPVIENMAALVIMDARAVQTRLNAEWAETYGLW